MQTYNNKQFGIKLFYLLRWWEAFYCFSKLHYYYRMSPRIFSLQVTTISISWYKVLIYSFYACFEYLPSCQEGLSVPVSTSGPIHSIAGMEIYPIDAETTTFGLVDGFNCTRNTTAWKYEKKVKSQKCAWGVLLICLLLGTCGTYLIYSPSPDKKTHVTW